MRFQAGNVTRKITRNGEGLDQPRHAGESLVQPGA